MSLHFNDLFLGSALPFKNVRLQVCGPRSRGGYHTETEFLRRYAHQHFPLFALPSPRLSGRVYICVILSLRLGRREGEREGEGKKGGRKRKKEKRRGKEGKGKKKRKSFDSIVSRSSTTTEVLRNLAASAVSYFERSLRLSFSLIGTSKVKHSNSGGVTVGKAFRSRVEKREEPRREEPCVEISASLKLRSNQRYEEGAKAA